jgi:hypothetical protein
MVKGRKEKKAIPALDHVGYLDRKYPHEIQILFSQAKKKASRSTRLLSSLELLN